MSERWRIASDHVVHGSGPEQTIGPGVVTIEGATIVAVEAPGEVSDGAPLLELPHHLLAPAFVNAHTHVALHALRGLVGSAASGNVVEDLFYRVESSMTAADVRAFARMGAWESLLSGVGLVWDHYFFGEALADGIADTGLAAVVAPTLQDVSGPGAGHVERALDATLALAEDARPTIFAALGPHATDTVSAELWARVIALSDRHDLPLHAHLAQSVEEVARAQERHGRSPLGWLRGLGVLEAARCVFAHALYVDRAELDALEDRHALVCCPYAQLIFGFVARVDEWERAGCTWTVATDCAASNDSMSLRKELRFAAGTRTLGVAFSGAHERFLAGEGDADAVWAERQARWAAFDAIAEPRGLLARVWETAGGLHPGFQAGVIAPGALANLVAYDLEHPTFWPGKDPLTALVLGDVDGAIDAMWVGGEEIGERGDFARSIRRSERYAAHRQEASERLEALLAQL